MTVAESRLRHATGVSWPRSGHHLLVDMLSRYFGTRFGYCEFYNPADCCRQVPCARPDRVHLSKNHDFDLSLTQRADGRFLLQWRAFLPSVVSNFELAVANGVPDTPAGFRRFVSNQFGRYRAFRSKWVESEVGAEILRLPYEALISDPAGSLGAAARFLAPDDPVDEAAIAQAVAGASAIVFAEGSQTVTAGAGIRPTRDPATFRFHDPALFEVIARLRLSRDEVVAAYTRTLGRAPAEEEMLPAQASPDIGALEAALRRSGP